MSTQTTSTRESSLSPKMPALDRLVSVTGGIEEPLAAFLGLQHLFGSTATLIRTLVHDRVPARNVHLLGKPYSAHPEVVRHMRDVLGYHVHEDSCRQPTLMQNDELMDLRIRQMLRRLRCVLEKQPARRALLIDDGGRAIRMLHQREFEDIRRRFCCVEQTRAGVRALDDIELEVPVINVAESWTKLHFESPMIAESVNAELKRQLEGIARHGISLPRHATIFGYGAIGEAVALELRNSNWRVRIYDPKLDRRLRAGQAGFERVEDRLEAIELGGLLIGCTGTAILSRKEQLLIPEGALLVSASSSDIEFRGWDLRRGARCLGDPRIENRPDHHACFSLYQVRRGTRRFHLVNGGFPVNFSGDVDPIEPEKIQLTRGLLYMGALQATRSAEAGLHALADDAQHTLLAALAESLLVAA